MLVHSHSTTRIFPADTNIVLYITLWEQVALGNVEINMTIFKRSNEKLCTIYRQIYKQVNSICQFADKLFLMFMSKV